MTQKLIMIQTQDLVPAILKVKPGQCLGKCFETFHTKILNIVISENCGAQVIAKIKIRDILYCARTNLKAMKGIAIYEFVDTALRERRHRFIRLQVWTFALVVNNYSYCKLFVY